MNKQAILTEIRSLLKDNVDQKILTSSKKFFKEEVVIYGVKTSTVGKIGKDCYGLIKSYPKKDIFDICEELWKSGYSEEAYIACNFSYYLSKQYQPSDFIIFERWVNNYVTNWATCDTLCNHTVGAFLEMYPQFVTELKKWARASNRWTKRAAAVSFIIPARKGFFLEDILEIADILLLDSDDLVQKGYGWMLKSASVSNVESIYNYVTSKKEIMPRTALRYAIEKMPLDMKAEAMMKVKKTGLL